MRLLLGKKSSTKDLIVEERAVANEVEFEIGVEAEDEVGDGENLSRL